MSEYSRVAVIGSNAFSGGHFIRHVLQDSQAEVIGFSRSPEYPEVFLPYARDDGYPSRFSFHQKDLNTQLEDILNICDDFQPEVIAHYAALSEVRTSWMHPEQWFQTNTVSMVKLTDELSKKDYLKKFLFVSTPEVYGSTQDNISENETYNPTTPYAISKLAGEQFVRELVKKEEFPAVFTRAANIYGIHQRPYRLIPKTIISILKGEKIPLNNGGKSQRSYIHASDVMDASWNILQNGTVGDTYHIAPQGDQKSVYDVVSTVAMLMGEDVNKVTKEGAISTWRDKKYSLSANKLSSELGWKQKVTFEQGVKEMISWIKDNWEYFKEVPTDYQHQA